jgi:cytidylate kinase
MAIITISRGTFSGGKMLAECLSRRLGYCCIDRDVLAEKAATSRVSQRDIRAALEEPPVIPGRFHHRRYLYLALIQASLAEAVRSGKAVYHGLAGQLLLKGAPTLLRLRIVAPLELRIHMARERLNLTRDEAITHIGKVDQDRRQWTHFLYGVDWGDPALYDLVINLERISIEQACALVISLTEQPEFEFSPEYQAEMNDLVLASRVRAELALNPFTSNLEVDVKASGGEVLVRGSLYEEVEPVERVVGSICGVTRLTVEDLVPAADGRMP